MRLLLAEDEKEMSAALSAILTHSGYDVDAVYDGQAAVEKALSQSYDCMIFDIMMPKKDGVQALKEIRDKGNMTPVIMLTAKAEIDDRITGLDAGADDYLTKPFAMGVRIEHRQSAVDVLCAVETHCRQCRTRRGRTGTGLPQFYPPGQ